MPPKVCMYCPQHAVPGKSRCADCGGGAWSRVDPSSKHRYDARWRDLRARVLRESPTCALCPAPATDADHIVAVADGGTDARENIRGLCNRCHKKHTAEQNRARRRTRPAAHRKETPDVEH